MRLGLSTAFVTGLIVYAYRHYNNRPRPYIWGTFAFGITCVLFSLLIQILNRFGLYPAK